MYQMNPVAAGFRFIRRNCSLFRALLFFAILTEAIIGAEASAASTGPKLVVGDGRYEESNWSMQLAVTRDDRSLLVSDFKFGLRVYDLATGALANQLEGHALEGDTFYDPGKDLFLTTGDRKIKIWDVRRQSLEKTINQDFHSQFMRDVYLDSTGTYLFAQQVKYDFASKKVIKRYEFTNRMWFFDDAYYLFDRDTGEVRGYNCADDTPRISYRLENYNAGINDYFDARTGLLYESYGNGVLIVDITNGAVDYALFDRPGAFDNLSITSTYAISADGRFLVAGSIQGAGLVVLEKIDPNLGFGNNTREVLRENLIVGEIHPLHTSNKVVYTTPNAIHLLDLESLDIVWETSPNIVNLRNIFLAPDATQLYLAMGGEARVNRAWFQRTFPHDFDTYFDPVDGYWGTFKPGLDAGDLPPDLLQLWQDRARMARVRLDRSLAWEYVSSDMSFPLKGTTSTTYDPPEGRFNSPSGRYSIEIASFGPSPVYEGQRRIGRLPDIGVIYHVEYSPDERYLAIGGSERWVAVMDLQTGKTVRKVYGEGYITSITFSYDNRYLFTASLKNEIMMWRLADGKYLKKFLGSNGAINDTEITPDGKTLISIADDGALRFWKVSTGKLIMSGFFMVEPLAGQGAGRGAGVTDKTAGAVSTSSHGRNWVVVTSDGRFDTNTLDQIRNLNWLMPDDPVRPLPLEIFMRDYYEPRLLPRLLAGETLPPIPALTDLNRVQPRVSITRIEAEADAPDLVTVTVEVEKGAGEYQRNGRTERVETGAYDLRLFREGQLVGTSAPGTLPAFGASQADAQSNQQRRIQWRSEKEIRLDTKTGRARLTFPHIRLPRGSDIEAVEFSAYAFNEDRVKSVTSRSVYELPYALPAKQGRAYIVSVGVNQYQDPAWNLTFAADDARRIQETLAARLRQGGQFGEVVQIPLLADSPISAEIGQLTENDATRLKIKTVLDLLAGREVETDLKKQIPRAAAIRPARPEDLVLISFSSHGYTDKQGDFYFFPSDIGRGYGRTVTRSLLEHTISSEELAYWLQDVDAGNLVLIVDACHSAATVEAGGFKPGPMGSRGLGQMAYDKGMRVLVASQAEDVALESLALKQGLLSYALVRDGLEEYKADFQPKDQTIFLNEWLEYAVDRVPALYTEIQDGTFKAKGVKSHFGSSAQALADPKTGLQQPSLFDFRKSSRDIGLSRGRP